MTASRPEDPAEAERWEAEKGQPYAEIKQVGRWSYHITIHWDGLMYDWAWRAWGRQRAERKARRLLAKHRRKQQREREAWKVTGHG